MNGNDTRLVLDQVHAVSDTAPGALKTLNLDNQPCGFFWWSYPLERQISVSAVVWILLN